MEKTKKALAKYCREKIEDYDLKVKIALERIDRMRYPLFMADDALYSEILEKVEEYCDDHGIDSSKFDVEEIFWEK